MNKLKIAIVHDWLTGMRGGEKCLEVFCDLFPDATVFTLFHFKGSVSDKIERMDIRTSFLQDFPLARKYYRHYLPFFPKAIESFDLSGFDLILSISHCAAKGIRKPEGAVHICYCLTPVRYAWRFFDEYFSGENFLKHALISFIIKYIKQWDLKANDRVDRFVAISGYIKERIHKCYGRDSEVIYPPVYIPEELISGAIKTAEDEPYYLVASAIVPYKRIDLAVKAFSKSGKKLVVIGKGSGIEELKAQASENIEFLGWVKDEELIRYYSGCEALIFPGEEDFGIVPLEVQMCGRPVIAYAAGGATETVIPLREDDKGSGQPTGVFFRDQTPESLNEAVNQYEKNKACFKKENMERNASRFGMERYTRQVKDLVAGMAGGKI